MKCIRKLIAIMNNFKEDINYLERITFFLRQKSMKRAFKFLHSCNHDFLVGEFLIPLLVVVRIEDRDDALLKRTISIDHELCSQGVPDTGWYGSEYFYLVALATIPLFPIMPSVPDYLDITLQSGFVLQRFMQVCIVYFECLDGKFSDFSDHRDRTPIVFFKGRLLCFLQVLLRCTLNIPCIDVGREKEEHEFFEHNQTTNKEFWKCSSVVCFHDGIVLQRNFSSVYVLNSIRLAI